MREGNGTMVAENINEAASQNSNSLLPGLKGKNDEEVSLSAAQQFLQLFNSTMITAVGSESLGSSAKDGKAFDSVFAEKAKLQPETESRSSSKESFDLSKKEKNTTARSQESVKTNDKPVQKTDSANSSDKAATTGTAKDESSSVRNKTVSDTAENRKTTPVNNQKITGQNTADLSTQTSSEAKSSDTKNAGLNDPLQEAIRNSRIRSNNNGEKTAVGDSASESNRSSRLASVVAEANKTHTKAKPAANSISNVQNQVEGSKPVSTQAVQATGEQQAMNQNGQQNSGNIVVNPAAVKAVPQQSTAKAGNDFSNSLKTAATLSAKSANANQNQVGHGADAKSSISKAFKGSGTEQTQRTRQAEIIKQIVRSAKMNLQNGKQEMKLMLKPEHLGWLKVKMNVDGQKVTAVITAESEQVKGVLEKNIVQLQTSLQNSNLRVNQIVVEVSGQEQTGMNLNEEADDLLQQNNSRHTGNTRNGKDIPTEDENPDDLIQQAAVENSGADSGGVDMTI
jgi:flagellar hook-length control protein FliK